MREPFGRSRTAKVDSTRGVKADGGLLRERFCRSLASALQRLCRRGLQEAVIVNQRCLNLGESDFCSAISSSPIRRASKRFNNFACLFLICAERIACQEFPAALSPPGRCARAIFCMSSRECPAGSETRRFIRRSNCSSVHKVFAT